MIEIHPKVAEMGGVRWSLDMTQEAARSAKIHQEKMNKSFRLPVRLPLIAKMAAEECAHVFNVGPFEDTVYLGSWGTVRVQPCPAGVDYVPVLFDGGAIPGVYTEMIPGEGKYDGVDVSGDYIAQEIQGFGPDLKQYRGPDRRKIGIFVGSVKGPNGVKPLKQEVEAARESVRQYLYELVLEANGAWGSGNEAEFKSVASTKHYLAAQLLEMTELPWYKARTAPKKEEKVPCQACGASKGPQYPRCNECGYTDKRHPMYEALFGDAPVRSAEEVEVDRLKAENAALAKKKN